MAKLSILRYPDHRLYTVAQPLTHVDEHTKKLVADMAETMYDAPGIGLAATQVDQHIQLLIIDISEEHNDLRVFINPKILLADGSAEHEEGCLSVPGIYDKVTRAEKITVEAMNLDGEIFTLNVEGLMAVCVQHEMDHLLGKVFVQYLSPLKQSRIKNKLKKRVLETM